MRICTPEPPDRKPSPPVRSQPGYPPSTLRSLPAVSNTRPNNPSASFSFQDSRYFSPPLRQHEHRLMHPHVIPYYPRSSFFAAARRAPNPPPMASSDPSSTSDTMESSWEEEPPVPYPGVVQHHHHHFHHHIGFYLPPPPPLVQPPARIFVSKWGRMPASGPIMPQSRDAWLTEARFRRAAYSQSFALPSLRWVLVEEGEPIPDDAIETGIEASGEPLYSIRAWHNGGLHLGKGGHHIFKGGSISWGSQEYACGTFEVLVGDGSLARWARISPRSGKTDSDGSAPESLSLSPLTLTPLASPSALPSLDAPKAISTPTLPSDRVSRSPGFSIKPFVAIEGGFEPPTVRNPLNPFTLHHPEDSTPPHESERQLTVSRTLLFIAQAWYADGWHPGKVEAGDDHCCIGWGGGEVWVKDFRILSWAV